MIFGSRLIKQYKQLHFSRSNPHTTWARCLVNVVPAPGSCAKRFSSSASKQMAIDSFHVAFSDLRERSNQLSFNRKFHAFRFSTLPEKTNDRHMLECFYSFIKSTFSAPTGSNYQWLNKNECYKQDFNEDGVFLIVMGAFLENPVLCSRDKILMIEKVKLLQQRYPKLQVFGFEHCNSVSSMSIENLLVNTIEEEYVTFPVLLTEKEFSELTKEPCYLLFEGLESPFSHFDWDVDIKVISRGIEKFHLIPSCNSVAVKELNSYGLRQAEVTKGYYTCPYFRNLILHHPGCVSVDECGKRLFLSDSNHHRIIITDVDGKIVDCIGFSSGFEDGGFEFAELLRPAGSVYHSDEDCLYFADSENHAIRRADLKRRVVETIYPLYDRKDGSIWNWIMDRIGMKRGISQDTNDLDPDSIYFPWHLMILGEKDLLVFNHSLESSWILNKETGHVKNSIRGFPKVMEAYKELIYAKASPVREILANWYSQKLNADDSPVDFQFVELMSTTAELNNCHIFCDRAGQKVLECNKLSGNIKEIQFSNLQKLGLPYWLACQTERVIPSINAYGVEDAHRQHFSLLPGRCDIWVNIHIPEGSKLVAPVTEECIWRQARGSAVEITDLEIVESTDKVGVAQQWYDELDNLAFSNPNEGASARQEDLRPTTNHGVENMVRIKSVVNTSPGTSELIVSTVLYLKLDEDTPDGSDSMARRLFEPGKCIRLLKSVSNRRGLALVKPLHVRIKLECADHPLRPNSREIISTNSNLQVKLSL